MDTSQFPFKLNDDLKIFATLISNETHNLNSLRNIQSF
jgi:hypothetical protein